MAKSKIRKDSPEKKQVRDLKLLKNLDFLFALYSKDFPLDSTKLKLLEKHGYINRKPSELPKKPKNTRIPYSVSDKKTEVEIEADSNIDIIVDKDMFENPTNDILTDEIVYSSIKNDKRFIYEGGKEIQKKDWMPVDLIYHKEDFVDWIDSINFKGFQKMTHYRKFQLYCQQAEDWLADKSDIYDFDNVEQRRDWAWNEMEKIKENSVYFLDKYVHVKEASYEDGFMDYKAKPVHKVMAYIFDCGYSFEMGKPRQIAATTTLGALATKKMITTKNFFIKMIAQDQLKVQEIFDDKIKYVFSELPEWLYQEPLNDRDNLLYIGSKLKKGKKGGVNSKIQVVAPTVSAINGGAPPLVLIDEGGYINILGKMIKQARPTMFMEDPITKRISMRRQICIWGTGGEMDKRGKAYAEEYKNTIDKWKKREFENGIIPLFFDWTTRPGINREFYLKEKEAYSVPGPDSEDKMVQFHQAYPSIIEDMFLTSSKTLVSIAYINSRLKKIRTLNDDQREQYGYFEPTYDTNCPSSEHDDLPFKLIGASFVPTEKKDTRASVRIFMPPEQFWKNRYYKGTDPINVDNGYSNMAGSIWDSKLNTVSAVMNYRSSNHKETFLQCLCLGLYYDATTRVKGVKDLVEGNIGTAYTDYVEFKGFRNSLTLRTELPSYFQGGQAEIGIDNRTSRTKFIINKLHELIILYGENIFIEEFWEQLSTFVCKITEKGNETWETQDRRKYHDDILFSTVFSYINAISFEHRPPINEKRVQDTQGTVRWKGVTTPDGTFKRVPVRKKEVA